MICWGQRDCCGIFGGRKKSDDGCECLPNSCIRDLAPEYRSVVCEPELHNVYDNLDLNKSEHFAELDTMLRLKSISSGLKYEPQIKQTMDILAERLSELEFKVEVLQIEPRCNEPKGYVIFADYFSSINKHVVLVYGQVDVPQVTEDETWSVEPFQLTKEQNMLYGKGVATSKGPLMCWLQAAASWRAETNDLPINLRFVIETNYHNNSRGLRELIAGREKFFKPVDLLIFHNNNWINERVPLLTTNLNGFIYFELEVRAKQSSEGQQPHELLGELCALMNTLTDAKAGVSIKQLQRHVLPLSPHDWQLLNETELGMQQLKQTFGIKRLPHEQSKCEYLKHKWCLPSLTMHGVQFATQRSVCNFHTPQRAVATFTVKLVPQQSLKYVKYLVRDYLDAAYRRLRCQHAAYLRVASELKPLHTARHTPFNAAAQRAYNEIFDVRAVTADAISGCCSIINELHKHCMPNAQIMGLPFCSIQTQPQQPDEQLPRRHYEYNLELLVNFIYQLAIIPVDCKCSVIKDFCYEQGKSTDRDYARMMSMRVDNTNTNVLYELDELDVERNHDKSATSAARVAPKQRISQVVISGGGPLD
ncbi:cytosolic non-specific dipeptidase-like [Drosophila busckii]|uniref:cytosolic non-specific dipeptidase-like n=1 Tax=Drosophila busckii TaxID=30019 RepID=UPI00083F296A|nr:cytosolic non-specific dipeptidase-like [Drosophila busckii]